MEQSLGSPVSAREAPPRRRPDTLVGATAAPPMALHDRLTGLANQALLVDRIERALARRGGGVSVLFVDLDRFRLVNDGHGQLAGDCVLRTVAGRLEAAVSPAHTVARYGGDQFVVVIEGTDVDLAVKMAREVTFLVGLPIETDGGELYVTASTGIAFGAEGEAAAAVIRNADTALHQAQLGGGGRFELFDVQARARAELRLSIESGLRRALDRHEFTLLYQPVVSLATGKMVGAEALLRWVHPDRGLIPPGDFVPLAEETGLIEPIGAWALERACLDAAAWNETSATPLRVSVNVSGRQLKFKGLLHTVEQALARSGLSASLLVLEITETALIGDFDASLATLDALKRLGVRVAIDDFGTGYSSLSYLGRLPLDIIKIDKCFVDGLGSNSTESAIMAAVSTLCRSLGFAVVAEGVETQAQATAVAAMACDFVQGFFFSPPVSCEELVAMLPARLSVNSSIA
jgi:diguanylate cyclase (GGDEF)-like protein